MEGMESADARTEDAMRGMLWALLPLALFACEETVTDSAEPTGGDEDLSLSPGFGEEVRSGTASGDEEYTSCNGYFPAQPQLVMTLEENFLAMFVQLENTDAIFMLRSDTGDYCSSIDTYPLPTVARGAWSALDYEVYVGTEILGGTADFTLTFAEGVPDMR